MIGRATSSPTAMRIITAIWLDIHSTACPLTTQGWSTTCSSGLAPDARIIAQFPPLRAAAEPRATHRASIKTITI